jgi:redox-sensitive bicupin YhaK (pirin superfamily)
MLQVRKSEERGRSRHPWLHSRHSFSFANYHDPAHMGFSVLRVINEDDVVPGAGFPPHSHRDMEIISYVLEGSIEHRDSLGHVSRLHAGEAQRMSAGSGVTHSEYNASDSEPLRFLQIWIEPRQVGIPPSYEQRPVTSQADGGFDLLVSPDARDGSMKIHQDASLYVARIARGDQVAYGLAEGRRAYLHVVRGTVQVNGEVLGTGDAVAVQDETRLTIAASSNAEVLLFDLP